jgi:carbon storage regulator
MDEYAHGEDAVMERGHCMLILTRRPHETIRIADRIRVTVLGFKGNQVRIGIEAPPDVTLDRGEVWERKQHEELVTHSGNGAAEVTPNGAAGLADSRPGGGSVPTLHEKARVP